MFKNKIYIKYDSFFTILFLLIIIFGLISNFLWLLNNTSLEDRWSEEGIFLSVKFINKMQEIIYESSFDIGRKFSEIFRLLRVPVEHSYGVYPQFVCFTTSLFYLLLGKTLLATKLSMLPYLLILLLSVFSIGKRVSSTLGGVVAACLVFMYPLIFESSRQYETYFSLTALVSLTILMLLKCDNFRNFKYSFLLGVIVGIGMLIKGQVLFFVGMPILCAVFNMIKTAKHGQRTSDDHNFSITIPKNVIINISIFIVLSASISYLWWGNKLNAASYYLRMHIWDPDKWRLWGCTGESRYSLATITWYLRDMYSASIGPVLFLSFLPSIYKLTKKGRIEKSIFLSWLITPILLFSLVVATKYPDYLMPISPIIAILTGWWIVNICNRKYKTILLFVIAVYSITQFYCLTFSSKELRGGVEGKNKLFGGTYFGDIKRKQDFKIDEIIAVLRSYMPNRGAKINVLLVPLAKERPRDLETLYWLMLKDRHIKAVDLIQFPKYVFYNLEDMDFVVFKMPKNYTSLTWPTKIAFLKMIEERLEPIEYNLEVKCPIWYSLLDKFCNSSDKYTITTRISPLLDYNWLIFRKYSE